MMILVVFAAVVILTLLFSLVPLPSIDWWITGVVLFCLVLTDQWTTRRFLRKGIEEGNPVWAFLFRKFGFQRSSLALTLVVAIMITLFWKYLVNPIQLAFLSVSALTIAWNLILPKVKEKLTKVKERSL